jgi:hypothetical protein
MLLFDQVCSQPQPTLPIIPISSPSPRSNFSRLYIQQNGTGQISCYEGAFSNYLLFVHLIMSPGKAQQIQGNQSWVNELVDALLLICFQKLLPDTGVGGRLSKPQKQPIQSER